MAQRMPALFVGHGNPMNALALNPYTRAWAGLGTSLQKPKAILSISAHWYIEDAAVTVSTAPHTIHDFGGFPSELYEVQYSAPGDPGLAARVQQLLSPVPVRRDQRWVSTTVLGRSCATSIREQIFRSFSSALTERKHHHSIIKSATAWHPYEKKGYSYLAVATSSITCIPMRGDGTRQSHMTGPSRSRLEFANCCSLKITNL